MRVLPHERRRRHPHHRVGDRRRRRRDRGRDQAGHPGRLHAAVAGRRRERADEARLLDRAPTRSTCSPHGPMPAAAWTYRRTRRCAPSELPADPIDRDIVTTPAEPYTGSPERPDDYRCVISEIPDPEGDGTWVTGIHFEPDADEVVHHSIISVSLAGEPACHRGARRRRGGIRLHLLRPGRRLGRGEGARASAAGPPADSPPCTRTATPPTSNRAPSSSTRSTTTTTTTKPPDQSAIVIDILTADEVSALEAAGEPPKQIRGRTFINPAEGPCTPEESGPLCDRDAVLDEISQKYGGFARMLARLFVGCAAERSTTTTTSTGPGSPAPATTATPSAAPSIRCCRTCTSSVLPTADAEPRHPRGAGPHRHPQVELRLAAPLPAGGRGPDRAGDIVRIDLHLGPVADRHARAPLHHLERRHRRRDVLQPAQRAP